VRVEGQTKDSGFGIVLRLETPILTYFEIGDCFTDRYSCSDISNIFVRTQALRETYELELFHDRRRTLVVVWMVKSRFRSQTFPSGQISRHKFILFMNSDFLVLLYVRLH